LPDSSHTSIRTPGIWPEGRGNTSLGLMIPVSQGHAFGASPGYADILAMSQQAAETGLDGLWFADHFSFPGENGLRGSWDAWTLMAAIAAAVPGMTIGPMVACTAYRNPGVIAKMTEMLAEITGGKFILGLGAGWQKDEYDQFGIRFEPRVSQFEEALEIISGLVRNGEANVQGTYYQANNARNLPRASHGPSVPIMIGSSSERMLGLLARHADAWNTGWYGSTDGIAEKISRLDAACVKAGRNPETVFRTVCIAIAGDGYTGSRPNPFRGDVAAQVQFLRDLESLGFRHICIGLDPCTPESIAAFAPVVAAFHDRAA